MLAASGLHKSFFGEHINTVNAQRGRPPVASRIPRQFVKNMRHLRIEQSRCGRQTPNVVVDVLDNVRNQRPHFVQHQNGDWLLGALLLVLHFAQQQIVQGADGVGLAATAGDVQNAQTERVGVVGQRLVQTGQIDVVQRNRLVGEQRHGRIARLVLDREAIVLRIVNGGVMQFGADGGRR